MKRWLKRIGMALGGLVALVVLALAGVYGFSGRRLARTYAVAPDRLAIPTDPASIERGHHLAVAVAKCLECHGERLEGKVFIDGGPAFGRIYAPNLTRGRGGIGAEYDGDDFVRAIRHGVAKDGRGLRIMPADDFEYLTDEDLADVIAYVRSVPAVDNAVPATVLGPVARLLYVTGKFPLVPAEHMDGAVSRAPVPAGPTPEYGHYLMNVGGCFACHGPGLSGGRVPGTPPDLPPAQNITPAGIGSWTEADFVRALRTGTRPDGTKIDPFMPWLFAGKMTDDEIRAVWLYVKSVPPRPTGTR